MGFAVERNTSPHPGRQISDFARQGPNLPMSLVRAAPVLLLPVVTGQAPPKILSVRLQDLDRPPAIGRMLAQASTR
jgi:hypothetical protein